MIKGDPFSDNSAMDALMHKLSPDVTIAERTALVDGHLQVLCSTKGLTQVEHDMIACLSRYVSEVMGMIRAKHMPSVADHIKTHGVLDAVKRASDNK